MDRQRHRLLYVLIPLVLLILGCPPPAPPPGPPPEEVFVDGMQRLANAGLTLLGEVFYLAPESIGTFLVQIRDPDTDEPVADALVDVALVVPGEAKNAVFEGQTDENGLLQVRFEVPAAVEASNQILSITAETPRGPVEYQEEVYVGRVYNVMLSTDKPVYQPGQTIHMRSLALDTTALAPATGDILTLTVADPEGNKLMRRELTTSEFGVAAADFDLDTQAASGDYQITAEMGPVSSSRSVEVKPYTLPRFEVTFDSDSAFFLPGEVAHGTVHATYFFGKPVAGGQVRIEGFATDVERFQVFDVEGETDEEGAFPFEFTVPDYFVGQLGNQTAEVDLEITVIDTANHAESIDESVTVAEQAILVDAVPESGYLRPGIENIVYVDASYPDGRSAKATLTIAAPVLTETLTVETDEFGLAQFSLSPPDGRDLPLEISATDSEGHTSSTQLLIGSSGTRQSVLLRPDKAAYAVGDTMNLDVFVSGQASTVYLDIIKGKQTFGLAALPVVDGMAQAAIDIDGSLLGTLELNAYAIAGNGEIVRDRRLALVDPAPADVVVTTDAAEYRPGDSAVIDVAVSRNGEPMPGVVGISIVDESVFSVGAQDPGFARTYFLLERELLEPRYEIHDFTGIGDDDFSPYDDNPSSIRGAQAATIIPVAQRRASADLALYGLFGRELAAMEESQRAESVALADAVPTQVTEETAFFRGWALKLALALPLLGVAAFGGNKRRRKYLLLVAVLALASAAYVSCSAGMPAAAPAGEMAMQEAPAEAEPSMDETTATRGQGEQPRLRQYFPETLYWQPEVITDDMGRAQVEVPIADSITTWRISVLASDREGNLGSSQVGMRVFQDFFVEPDLPRFLTVGDELDVPVSLFNYLDEPQSINLQIAQADWFELLGEPTVSVEMEANAVASVYIPLRVTNFGLNDLQITAHGSTFSDAVLRQVEVLPNGQAQTTVQNGKLAAEQILPVALQDGAIPGSGSVTVKLYPGVVSQVIDGLEGLLQQPYGCFEQTSSTTYPNVLVLDYMKATEQADPRLQLQAEQYINLGYQRLLSFEVNGFPGGFSLFGDPPAQTMLTAYGLMEFADMSRVSYVDPDLLARTAEFLFQRQNPDGSWTPQGMTIESGVERMGEESLAATSYMVWALADAGYANAEPIVRALAYVDANSAGLTGSDSDPYVQALVANALVAAGERPSSLLDALIEKAMPGPEETLRWQTGLSTWLDSHGPAADLETTAMVAIALLRSQYRLDVAQQAIDYIVSQRDSFGSFHTTQATILSLKALLLAAEGGGQGESATVTISLDGGRTETIVVDPSVADVVQQVTFDDLALTGNDLSITVDGNRTIQYQLITRQYVPWELVTPAPDYVPAMRVDVGYDRTELAVNDTVDVVAEIELLAEGEAGTVLVDLGIPPGFSPITSDLDDLVERDAIQRYELTGWQIILYLTDVPSGVVYRIPYRLQARFPIRAQTPSSTAYDYYAPDTSASDAPQRIRVTLGTPGS